VYYFRTLREARTILGTMALALFTIAVQMSGQTGRVAQTAGGKTPSSATKLGNVGQQSANDVTCVASGSNSPGVKIQPAAPGQQHHVDLSWIASNSAGAVKYNVHRCGRDATCLIISVAGTNYSDTQVQPLQAFCYFVTAAAANRPESGPSNVLQVVIPSP